MRANSEDEPPAKKHLNMSDVASGSAGTHRIHRYVNGLLFILMDLYACTNVSLYTKVWMFV